MAKKQQGTVGRVTYDLSSVSFRIGILSQEVVVLFRYHRFIQKCKCRADDAGVLRYAHGASGGQQDED